MKQLIILALLLSLTAASAEARPRKHGYKDPKWLVGEGVIIGLIVTDAVLTSQKHQFGHEGNPILGPHPSNGAIAGVAGLNAGVQTLLHYGAWHYTHHVPIESSCAIDPQTGKTTYRCTEFTQDRLGWRIFGYLGVPAANAIVGGHAIARNYQLR